jgi:hypothetical protein
VVDTLQSKANAAKPQEMLSKSTNTLDGNHCLKKKKNLPKAKSLQVLYVLALFISHHFQDTMLMLIIQREGGGLCISFVSRCDQIWKQGYLPKQAAHIRKVKPSLLARQLLPSTSNLLFCPENACLPLNSLTQTTINWLIC